MNKKTLSRRSFLRMAGGLAVGTLAAACAPKTVIVEKEKVVTQVVKETVVVEGTPKVVEKVVTSTPEPAAPPVEPVTITWWHEWGGTTGMAAMTAVAESYNALGTPITVDRLYVAEMNDKLLTAVAGGTPPDVGVCCVQYASMYALGAFMPLDDLVAASTVVDLDDFVEGLVESMTWQGKLYGCPGLECGPRYGLMMNRDIVEGAGLDADNPPQTWDEMYDWHEKMTQFDAAGNVEVVGFDPRDATGGNGPASNVTMFWAVSAGLHVWNGQTYTFDFDNEKMVSALEAIKRFYDLVGAEKMAAFRGAFGGWTQSPSSSFPSGVQGALVTGYYAPGELSHSAPDKRFAVGWAPMPEERRGVKVQNVGGHPMYIPKGAAHPNEGFKFIEYMTGEGVAKIMFETTGWFPGRTSLYESDVLKADRYETLPWYVNSVLEADELWAGPVIPIQGFVNQQRGQMYDAVIYGDKTPAQAAADMQQICSEELAKQFPELVG
jgi:ABC-type glycerol-3-phosphate transport system substrate-binding protein